MMLGSFGHNVQGLVMMLKVCSWCSGLSYDAHDLVMLLRIWSWCLGFGNDTQGFVIIMLGGLDHNVKGLVMTLRVGHNAQD